MKTSKKYFKLVVLGAIMVPYFSFGQYNKCAAQNVITEPVEEVYYDAVLQKKVTRTVDKPVTADSYGNPQGNQYDLAIDGAFEGQTVAVLHLYTGEGFDFELPKNALKEKGFSVYRWINNAPDIKEFKEGLEKACQLWIISDSYSKLSAQHVKAIKDFFDGGKGVYIWGDNQPYYADANIVAKALIGLEMKGNTMGAKVVNLQTENNKVGLIPNHLISTGIQNIYEGITIATLDYSQDLTPLIYGSANNLVTAAYEKNGKRLILDGGFTRLYVNWDSAGTGRYVKNAAAWLVNYEKFGKEVVSEKVK